MFKSYKFTRIDQHGAVQNCFASVRVVTVDYPGKILEIYFTNYESPEEQAAGSHPRLDFRLRLEGEKFTQWFSQPIVQAELAAPLYEVLGRRIWKAAVETSFIDDYAEKAEDGRRKLRQKSLTDLKAREV